MPHTFATSPGAQGEQRKFTNPTPEWQGANIFGPDGTPTAVPVEPGGDVWLTPAEERMTAEAPRLAANNPFVKEWDDVVERDPFGEPSRTERRHGVLVASQEPPRPVSSDRFIPPRPETVIGASVPEEERKASEGEPVKGEVLGSPEAAAKRKGVPTD